MRIVRELTVKDVDAFREIRLEALLLHPYAFGSVYAVEVEEPVSAFAQRVASGGLFGGFSDGQLMGMAGFSRPSAAQLRHKGTLGGMYVRASERGTGLAGDIVAAVLQHARKQVELVQLAVATTNARAVRFYQRLGFQIYATELKGLKVGERYVDEHLMVLFLDD